MLNSFRKTGDEILSLQTGLLISCADYLFLVTSKLQTIPNIPFKSKNKAKGIEFLNLTELFSRIQEDPNHDPKKPHRIKFNALLIVTEGKGSHQIDLKKYQIQKGDVLKIARGQVHAFQGDLNYKGVLVVFTEDYVLKYFSKSSLEIISHFYNYHISTPIVKNCSFNEGFIQTISEEMHFESNETQQNIMAKLVELYLLRLERLAQNAAFHKIDMKYYPLFAQFQILVTEKHSETRNVTDYAKLLNISTKHLNTVVKSITLNTAKSFIDQYIILETKRLIQSSDKSLKEISFQMGFDEVTNFSKYFKKQTATSPKEYRSQL